MNTTTLIISSGFIAGVPHRNPDLTVVNVGDVLRLDTEPENPYDPDAIKIVHGPSGQFLGYVPREQTGPIHLAIKEGFTLTASVREVPLVKWKEVCYIVTVEVLKP